MPIHKLCIGCIYMRIDEVYNFFVFFFLIPVIIVTLFRLCMLRLIKNKEKYNEKNSVILTIGLYISGIWVLVTFSTFIIDVLYFVRVYLF